MLMPLNPLRVCSEMYYADDRLWEVHRERIQRNSAPPSLQTASSISE
ncbi:hypothetical protein ACIQWL_37375 [Streptomyces mirabilis]